MNQNPLRFVPNLPRPVSGVSRPDDEDDIDLGKLIGALWLGKWFIGLMTALAIIAGGVYAFRIAVPHYVSTAVVMMNTRQEQIVDLQSVVGGLTGDSAEVNSEVEVLRSRGLLGKVVDKLDLTTDPEFNQDQRAPGLVDVVKGSVKAMVGLGEAEVAPSPEAEATSRRQAAIDALLEALTVRVVPASLVFQVTVVTESPQKSARIADTIVDLYILNQLETKFDATQQATAWLTDRVSELKQELETAEARVKDFNSGTDLVDQDSLAALERQVKELRDRIAASRNALAEGEARLARMRVAATPDEKAGASGDVQLARLLPRVDEPSIGEGFELRWQQVLARAETDQVRGRAQVTALERSRAEIETQIAQQSQDLITLQQLTREADASRMLYEYFLSRLKETSAQQGIQQADSRILSHAVLPTRPASPRKSLILIISGLLGLTIGSGLVLFREWRNEAFRSATDLERATGYTVMGQIPTVPGGRRRDVIAYLLDRPNSAMAEAVRNLRTSILLSSVETTPKVVQLTSSLPGEGKTTMSLALAQVYSGLGKRVLLVEGDMRRRVFSQYLRPRPGGGILAVMSEGASLADAVQTEDRLGVDVLVGDRSVGNPADLFSSERFAALLDEARRSYDAVILDTPPVLVVPDARITGKLVDAVVFVVRWDRTSAPQVREGLHLFETANVRVSGLVLNGIDPKGMRRYGYGGQYGAYSAYGRKYYVN